MRNGALAVAFLKDSKAVRLDGRRGGSGAIWKVTPS
jgi:hypothetical protein